MKKPTSYDPPEPRAGEVSASQGLDHIPQAEIIGKLEDDEEVLELVGSAYFTPVDEATGPQSGDAEAREAASPSPLPHGREPGTTLTPERSELDRETYDTAAVHQSIDSDASPEEMPFGPPPVLVLAGAVVLLLVILALWR